MSVKDVSRQYLENVLHYNRIVNRKIPSDASDTQVLSEMEARTRETIALRKAQNAILQEYLVPYENGDRIPNAEEAERLEAFADSLSDAGMDLDAEVSLRIHRVLLKYAESIQDHDAYIRQLQGCGVCEWNLHYGDPSSDSSFQKIYGCRDLFPSLSEDSRTMYIKCLVNSIMVYTNRNAGKLIREGERILAEMEELETEFGTLPIYGQARYAVCTNIATAVSSFRKGIDDTPENRAKVLYYAEKAEEEVQRISPATARTFAFCSTMLYARFHGGKLTIEELLTALEGMIVEDPSLSPYENCNRVIHGTAGYNEYMRLYSSLPEEEIKRRADAKVDHALAYSETLERTGKSSVVSAYLTDLVDSVACIYEGKKAAKILFTLTMNRHRPAAVHTLIVERLSACLVRKLLDHNPEVFDFADGNRDTICRNMTFGALLHDIGKQPCFMLVSNSSRDLDRYEFEIIQRHPRIGSEMIERSSFSEAIKECVLYHHVWYDGKGGYPQGLPCAKNRALVDILSVSDSLEAATDRFGRSYSREKKPEDVLREFEEERDVRYAGFVLDELAREDTRHEILEILQETRREYLCRIYRNDEAWLNRHLDEIL